MYETCNQALTLHPAVGSFEEELTGTSAGEVW